MVGASPKASPLLPTFARQDLAFERGEGVWLINRDGERYLDFGAGVAVTSCGHANPLLHYLSHRGDGGRPNAMFRPSGRSGNARLVGPFV